jgi:hypothetical protein
MRICRFVFGVDEESTAMQTKSKLQFDPESPKIKAYLDDVHHGTFIKEGTMVACPTCYPGMTTPIPLDECHITALDGTPKGTLYGGTSGHQAHLFIAQFHGLSGVVFEMAAPEGATNTVAACCAGSRMFAFVNGARGGRAVSVRQTDLFGEDFIQEWGFTRPALADHGECFSGEPVVHAIAGPERKSVVAITSRHIVTIDATAGAANVKLNVAGEVPGSGRIALGSWGGVFGRDDRDSVWRFDVAKGNIARRAFDLPKGFGDVPLIWATDPSAGLLYTADAAGRLYSLQEGSGFSAVLAQAPLAPVGPMAVTFDGRLFGFCGDEMSKMFCFDPATGKVANLGVAASVLERRRYGYTFGDAMTGRDGEIVFGENDNGGHLWLYFPRIKAAGAKA